MQRFMMIMLLVPWLVAAGDDPEPAKPKQNKTTKTAEISLSEVKALVDAGQFKSAVKKGLKLAKAEKNAEAYNLVGYSYRKLKSYKKSIKAYKLALKYDPDLHQAKEYLAVAYLNTGKTKRAKKLYNELKKDAPELADMLKKEADKLNITL